MPAESRPILVEIQKAFGFVPPALRAVGRDPATLSAAWLITQAGYVRNTLPTLFKEKFMAVMAKYSLTPYSLIVRSCSLRRLGMTGQQILEFLRSKLPAQRTITEQIRTISAGWSLRSGWPTMPPELEMWLLWAAVRMTLRKDPGGRCRDALHDALGDELFNKVVTLATFAADQRVWIDAHPEFDAMQDERVIAGHRALLKETPEFAQIWDSARKRSTRRTPGPRERKLLAEIARQDRARESLRHSEERFRKLVQSMPFPVLVYAADGEVVMVNRAWTQQSGWSLKDLPTMADWFHKGEHDRNRWQATDVESLYDWPEPVEEGEHTIFTKSGQARVWDFSTVWIGKLADGRQGLMRTASDVSERHRLQSSLWETNQRISQILESITDAFIAFDKSGTITWMNQEAARMFGCERESVIGRNMLEAFPAVADSPLSRRFIRCMEERRTEHFESFSPALGLPLEVHAYGSEDGLTVYFHDISERKRMEEAVRSTNEHLSGVLGSITDAFLVLDREHRITWINQKAGHMLHVDHNTAVGKTLEAVGPQSARRDITQQIMQCMEQCKTLHLEYYSDAMGAHVELHAYGWNDGVAVHFRDVSERKRMEQALRASEQKFRGLFESEMVGIMFADRFTGHIHDCNDAFLKMIGYDRDDLRAGRLNWIELTAPEQRAADARAVDDVGIGPLTPYEKDYIHKDGHRIPVLIGGAPVTPGEATVMAFVIDLTAEKTSEQRERNVRELLDAVLEATPVSISVLDLQGRVIMWNDAATRLFGWTKDDVIGRPITDVLGQDRERHAQTLARRRAGESLWLTGIGCLTKDRRRIYVDARCHPVRDTAGKVIALMTVVECEFAVPQHPPRERWVSQ